MTRLAFIQLVAWSLALGSLPWYSAALFAQDPPTPASAPDERAAHDDLMALRDRILSAYEKKDVEGLLKEVHPKVVVTWQNGEVNHGHEGVREFYKKTVEGPDAIVKDLKTKLTVDGPSALYLDQKLALATGRLDDDFTLRDGKHFQLASRWTATLIKEEDSWKIIAFHVSANVFENGVLDLFVQQNRLYVGIGAALVGLIVGGLVATLLRKKGPKTS